MCKRNDFWSRIKARQMLHTAKDFEHERLEAHHVDNVLLPMLQAKQKTFNNAHMKTLKKLGFSFKN